jgi:hypothetical protein
VGGSQLGCSPNPSMLRHRNEPENSRESGVTCFTVVAEMLLRCSMMRQPHNFEFRSLAMMTADDVIHVYPRYLMKFLQYPLDAVRPFETISVALELSPGNTRARRTL